MFPTIPDEWLEETVSFDTFRAEKGLLVSAVLEEGVVTKLTLTAERDVTAELLIDEKSAAIAEKLNEKIDGMGSKMTTTGTEKTDRIKVCLAAGECVTVEI